MASPAATAASQSMLTGTFAPMFPIELAEKDLRYVEETARARHAAAPMAAAARAVMQRAIERGYGADNLTGAVRLYATGS